MGVRIMLVVGFLFVPSVSTTIFRARACVGFGEDDMSGPTRRERFYLRSDLSVECYASEKYERLEALMWVFVGVWPVGMVLFYALVLYPCRHAMIKGEMTSLTRSVSFLTKEYEPHVYFWEVLDLGDHRRSGALPTTRRRRQSWRRWSQK